MNDSCHQHEGADMTDWIEPMDELQVRLTKQLPVIKLKWETTTVPEQSVRLPINAYMNVTAEAIQVHAARKDEDFYPDEEINLQFRKQDIVSVDIILMPELESTQWTQVTDYSRAIIRHRDPFEVVPYFESVFVAYNDYWLRALAKALKEVLGVKYSFNERTNIVAPTSDEF
jgi:hypothetical protein